MTMPQKLHCRQILVETNGELEVTNIDSEDEEITEDLFKAVQKVVKFESKILSIARVN